MGGGAWASGASGGGVGGVAWASGASGGAPLPLGPAELLEMAVKLIRHFTEFVEVRLG